MQKVRVKGPITAYKDSMKKKLYIKTYGCQMNVYDSKRMEDVLTTLGYESVAAPEEADLAILNTCHIREKAAEKVYSDLGRLRQMNKAKNDARGESGDEPQDKMAIAVAGCVAQAEGSEIFRRAPYVDMVFGPQTYHRLPEMIARLERDKLKKAGKSTRILDTDFPVESKFDELPTEAGSQGTSAFLSIQEGCDKFCTFCVVPYTRGAEASRPAADVLAEAKRLIANGAKEITLLGQNVNAYHGTGPDGTEWTLGRLLFACAELDGLERLRYTTSHPRDMHDELYQAHGEIEILMPYLHLPVQSGSDRVLQAMNRKHTGDEYRAIIDRLRDVRPDMAFSSDFIVGFPGESDKDFKETLRLVEDVTYAQAYSFKYSARPGTPASAETLQVEESVKSARLQELQALLNVQQHAFNEDCAGKVMPALFEKAGKKPGQIAGKTPYMQTVNVMASHVGQDRLIGEILPVKITSGQPNSLIGELELLEESAVMPNLNLAAA